MTTNIVLLLIVVSSLGFSQTQQRFTKIESDLSPDELYERGRDEFTHAATSTNARLRADNLKRAVRYFEQTIAKDSSYFQAYLALLQCYSSMSGVGGAGSSESTAKIKAVATKAIQLDGELPDPHQSLAWVMFQYDWDWEGAEMEFKRTLDLNFEFTELWPRYASFLVSQGKPKEALLEAQRLSRLMTDKGWANFAIGYIYFWSRQYDSAIVYYKKAIEVHYNIWQYHFNLGFAYARRLRYDDALEEFRKGVVLSGRNTTAISGLGFGYALADKKHEALSTLEELEKGWESPQGSTSLVPAYRIAAVYAALDEKADAIEWLGKALESRSSWLVWLKVDPAFDGLHKEPKFLKIFREMKFPR